MYEVRNKSGDVVREEESFQKAKEAAEEMATADRQFKFGNGPFAVIKVEIVYTTQTLDEALKR